MQKKVLIGNTPLIKINFKYKNIKRFVYVKLEYFNLTGSIKDRVALYIINEPKKKGILKDNQPIIEATSGNTGISFAAIGTYLKHPVHIFMPDWVSKARIDIMKLYGAKVYLVSKEEGGFKECIKRADNLANEINGYRPNQFTNYDNVLAHFHTTAKEILEKVIPTGVVSGIGTGGTLMGVAKGLKKINNNIKVIALEPLQLPILSEGKAEGKHKIEGIGDDFIPDIVDKTLIDDVIVIDDNDAINMSKRISQELGIGVGISSGANFLAAVLSNKNGLVTFFVDDCKKYLSTDLFKNKNNSSNLISKDVEIIDYEVM